MRKEGRSRAHLYLDPAKAAMRGRVLSLSTISNVADRTTAGAATEREHSQGHASSISAFAPFIAATSTPADPNPVAESSETAFATIFPSRAWAQKRATGIVACPALSVFTDKVSGPIASVHPTAGRCGFSGASRSTKARSTAPPPRR